MEDQKTIETETLALARIVKDGYKADAVELVEPEDPKRVQVVALPDGKGGPSLVSTKPFHDAYKTVPDERRGRAVMTQLDSFIAHAQRFMNGDSALFARDSQTSPQLTAVLDYHDTVNNFDSKGEFVGETDNPSPRNLQHRTTYAFPLSDEWSVWMEANDKPMNLMDFAEFLEDRIVDVMAPPRFLTAMLDPNATDQAKPDNDADNRLQDLVIKIGGKVCGPAKLMELSKGLQIHDQQKVKQVQNVTTGEAKLVFESDHRDSDGKPLSIPNLFLIGIPVFRNGATYRIPVRLRYRISSGSVIWILKMHRPDLMFDHAFQEACEKARKDTGLPLFYGAPEETR